MSTIEVLLDVTAHSENDVLIRSDIGAKTVLCSGIEVRKFYC
jgi:hypothetical protein